MHVGLAVHCKASEPLRAQYLLQTLQSLETSGMANSTHVFLSPGTDCKYAIGMLSNWPCYARYETDAESYIEQFEAMHARFEGRPFIFCESDVIFARNWYAQAMQAIGWLKHCNKPWSVIGLYSADNTHNVRATGYANLLSKGSTCFYGTCCTAFNTNTVPAIMAHAKASNLPFDLAIADLYGPRGELFVHKPSLAQHIGRFSSLRANWHEASDFTS